MRDHRRVSARKASVGVVALLIAFACTTGSSGAVARASRQGDRAAIAPEIAPVLVWAPPQSLEEAHGLPSAIGCPAFPTCVVVDDSGDVASRTAAPKEIDTASLTAVSCPTSSFCAAVDDRGFASTWNGSVWTSGLSADNVGFTALDCTTASFCVATDLRGRSVAYNGVAWSSRKEISGLDAPDAVGCASASLCVAVNGAGDASVFTGSKWSTAAAIDTASLEGVSCSSTQACLAVDDQGRVVAWDGTRWSTPRKLDSPVAFVGVSCPASPSPACVAVDARGRLLTLANGKWSSPKLVDQTAAPVAITCVAVAMCALVDVAGYEYADVGGSWTHARIDTENGYLLQVACGSRTACVAVGSNGEVANFNGTQWQPLVRSPLADLGAVSCLGTFCAMGGGGGDVVTWSSKWSRASKVGSTAVTGISCVSASFCMAVNSLGQASTWNGSKWFAPADIDYPYGRGFGSVSCATSSVCVITDHTGREILWERGRRPTYRQVDTVGGDLTSIACPSAAQCLAVDAAGYVVATTFNLATSRIEYTRPRKIDPDGITSVSCVSASVCVAVDTVGKFLTWYQGTWSKPMQVAGVGDLVSLGCTSGVCAALDENDRVAVASVP